MNYSYIQFTFPAQDIGYHPYTVLYEFFLTDAQAEEDILSDIYWDLLDITQTVETLNEDIVHQYASKIGVKCRRISIPTHVIFDWDRNGQVNIEFGREGLQ